MVSNIGKLLMAVLLSCALSFPLFAQQQQQQQQRRRPPNVLFITIDDLRPQLGCYGDSAVKSPNIDGLAKRGMVFSRAYSQQALCAPSRASFLTGRRPDTTRVYNVTTHFREALPDVVTLPQLFKQNGYFSQGLYKIYHLAGFDPKFANLDDPPSWSAPLWLPTKPVYGPVGQRLLEESYARIRASGRQADYNNIPRSLAYEAPDIPDGALSDGETADRAIAYLRDLRDQPFFLAVGFYKPHLPFVAPRMYWNLYRERDIKLPDNVYPPKDAPPQAVISMNELRSYVGMPKSGDLSKEQARDLLHGYLASISYIDAQVGRVLAELDKLKLRENTIVVLLGDHGYQIGEHNLWASKHTNFETSTRVPLIISAPKQKTAGGRTNALVELVDVYPTLTELAGLPAPTGLEGTSLKPLLDNSQREWKSAAFSQYPRGRTMGRSMRTDRYRYTEWAETGQLPSAIELYDHLTDPDENQNIANRTENRALVNILSKQLRSGWRSPVRIKERTSESGRQD